MHLGVIGIAVVVLVFLAIVVAAGGGVGGGRRPRAGDALVEVTEDTNPDDIADEDSPSRSDD